MVTESLIRKKFVLDTLRQGTQKIEGRWQQAIGSYNVQTGRLRAFGDHPVSTRRITSYSIEQTYSLPLHLRMLDIRQRRKKNGRNLYNKVVWPILYEEVLPELRYGFSQEVRQQIRESLEKATGKQ